MFRRHDDWSLICRNSFWNFELLLFFFCPSVMNNLDLDSYSTYIFLLPPPCGGFSNGSHKVKSLWWRTSHVHLCQITKPHWPSHSCYTTVLLLMGVEIYFAVSFTVVVPGLSIETGALWCKLYSFGSFLQSDVVVWHLKDREQVKYFLTF